VHCQEPIALFGYRDCEETKAVQKGLWKESAHETDLPTIRHRITTIAGNSGSPLLVKRNKKEVAIAIHKGERKGAPYNGARAITRDLLADLLTWEKEMASEIRFCLMTSNPQTADREIADQWLASVASKIKGLLSDMQSIKLK
jgi:hypothetical protein